jgi:glycosyltransferase involved in cell wall biosynthesis
MITRSLRILSVNISDTQGGASRASVRINEAIRKQGVEMEMLVKHKNTGNPNVIPLSHFEPGNLFYKICSYGQNKIKNKTERILWSKYSNREDVFLSDLRSVPLHGALQKLNYDVLHLHWINLRFLDLKELKKVGKPIVWTLHDCWPFTGICHYFYECTNYKKSCGRCPALHSQDDKDLSHKVWKAKSEIFTQLNLHIVTPSKWLAEAARGSSLFGQLPVTVIPHCIDTDLFSPGDRIDACNNLGLDPDKRYVLYGALNALQDKRKGFRFLDAAMEILVNKPGFSDVELLIFGVEKQHRIQQSKYKIKVLGILGEDQQLVTAYRSANVMVVPSLTENFSLTIMESMACGTPVTAFNTGGNAELIDHLGNGYLARKVDPSELADGISWCLNKLFNNELSNHARNKIMKNYSPGAVSLEYLNVFQSICHG